MQNPILIALAIAQTAVLASSALAQATDAVLPEVTVTSTQDPKAASVAGFTETPLLETPAAVNVISRRQIEDLGIRQTADLMKLDASLNESYNAVGYAEQFSIRGFALDNASSYRQDGLIISSDASIPFENKERIEVLKGLSGLQSGVSTPGGILNYVVKRPTNTPLRSITLEANEFGNLYGAMDIGGRSDDKRFGYRINAAAERLRSYVDGADGKRQFVSGAFDWRLSPQAVLQLDVDYQHKSQLTAPGFQLLNNTTPPKISPATMLNNQPWSKPVETDSANVGLRFDYQLNADWSTTLSANRNTLRRDDFAAFPYGCASAGLFPGFCGNGDFDVYDYQSEGERKTLLSTQALLQGKFTTGAIAHQFTAGVSTVRRRDRFGDCVYGPDDCLGFAANGTSNIYNPVVVDPSLISTGPVRLRRAGNERSIFTQDIIALNAALKLHAGVRYTELERDQFDANGVRTEKLDRSYVLPNVALVFSPRQNWSVYGSYSEGLEHGGTAGVANANANEVLDPARSKQYELGVKADLAQDFSMSAAIFQIEKPFEYTDAGFTFVRDGDALHRGIELAAQGKATRNLSVGASITALDAKLRNTAGGVLDDKRVTNVPELKSAVYADYAVPQVVGLNISGVWHYVGNKAFDAANAVSVPSYHLLNLGARYKTRIGGNTTTFRLSIDNVFDKFYWRDVTQQLGGYLLPGAPRTVTLTAQYDF